MQKTRQEMRESTFILLFESLFRDDTVDELIELAENIDDMVINERVIRTFQNTINKAEELDAIISKLSDKRSVLRIPKVNLAILRLALYEALYEEKVPTNVAISEAVLLAKKYAYQSDVVFINGVLGNFSREFGDNQNA